jgi:protease II
VTIVPEQPQAVLESVVFVNDKYLVLTYLHNVENRVIIADLDVLEGAICAGGMRHSDTQASTQANNVTNSPNTLPEEDRTLVGEVDWITLRGTEELKFPVGCSTSEPSGRHNEPRVFFRVYGYTLASRIYKYTFDDDEAPESTPVNENDTLKCTGMDLEKRFGKLSIWRESVVKGFDPDRWIAEKVWVPNPNDGVRIPMFIVRDKSLVETGNATCVLYGYATYSSYLL